MYGILTALALIVAVVSGFMYVKQPDMVFYPIKELRSAPIGWGMEYKDVELVTTDGVGLHGWYIPANRSQTNTSKNTNKTLLFFHGNAGNISHRGESIKIFHQLGLNVFILDYRGYGQSQGEPSEVGLYEDARAAWQYLAETRRIPEKDIVLFGRSLGGAVATKLASEVKAGGLILESTFSSAQDMADSLFPVVSHVIFMRFKFNTEEIIKTLHCPLLVIHSPDDDIIPYQLGKKVFVAANEPKTFLELKGDHNGGFLESQPHYQQTIADFLATLNKASPKADNSS